MMDAWLARSRRGTRSGGIYAAGVELGGIEGYGNPGN